MISFCFQQVLLIMGLLTKPSESYRSAPLGWPRLSESLYHCLLYRVRIYQAARIILYLVRISSDSVHGASFNSIDRPFLYWLKESHLHMSLIGVMVWDCLICHVSHVENKCVQFSSNVSQCNFFYQPLHPTILTMDLKQEV